MITRVGRVSIASMLVAVFLIASCSSNSTNTTSAGGAGGAGGGGTDGGGGAAGAGPCDGKLCGGELEACCQDKFPLGQQAMFDLLHARCPTVFCALCRGDGSLPCGKFCGENPGEFLTCSTCVAGKCPADALALAKDCNSNPACANYLSCMKPCESGAQ